MTLLLASLIVSLHPKQELDPAVSQPASQPVAKQTPPSFLFDNYSASWVQVKEWLLTSKESSWDTTHVNSYLAQFYYLWCHLRKWMPSTKSVIFENAGFGVGFEKISGPLDEFKRKKPMASRESRGSNAFFFPAKPESHFQCCSFFTFWNISEPAHLFLYTPWVSTGRVIKITSFMSGFRTY